MALLTDKSPSYVEDLISYDSGILEVAKNESVNLESKLGVAWEALQLEVDAFLLHHSGSHQKGVGSAGPSSAGVVVNTAMRRWHALQTLTLVYTDLYGSQRNNRYQVKANQFERMTRDAKELVLLTGLGLVWKPIPKAPKPNVMPEGTGSLTGTFLLQTQYCGTQVESGAPSEEVPVVVAGAAALRISLNHSQSHPAAGYHVYLRTPDRNWGRQTSSPVASNEAWLFGGQLVQGQEAGEGQAPDYQIRLQRILPKG